MKKTFCEMVFGESYQMPVETCYMYDVVNFMETNCIKYNKLGNYRLPKVGRFWIVELYSAGSIAASVQLVNDELFRLRTLDEKRFERQEKDYDKK